MQLYTGSVTQGVMAELGLVRCARMIRLCALWGGQEGPESGDLGARV